MANEFELSNSTIQTDEISASVSAAFVTTDNVLPLISTEPIPAGTNVKKWRKLDKGEAQAVAESGNYSYDADSEPEDTSVTTTAAKKAFVMKPTVESNRFGGPFGGNQRVFFEAGGAYARLAASELKTLFSSVSGSQTATSTLTRDDLIAAKRTVAASMGSAFDGRLNCLLDYKGVSELELEAASTGASAYVSQVNLGGLLGALQAPQVAASYLGIDIYATDGLPTDSGDDVGCLFSPLAFCAIIDNGGFQSAMGGLTSQGFYEEVLTWTFWDIKEWNDTAAIQIKSDT